jgi:hypothetical protein
MPGLTTRARAAARWTAVLALLIASVAAPVMAQETDTVKISGRFSMDYLNGESDLNWFVPDLVAVYNNGHEHTWTLTLHGTTQSHYTNAHQVGAYYATEIHATSFDLEFFGPDAAALNGIVSEHLAGGDVHVYLENTYYYNGGGFAVMHVWVSAGDPGMSFYTGHDMGVFTLFPTDADGYPVVGSEPFSIEPDVTELGYFDMFSGTGGAIGSLAGPVTFEGSVGSVPPHPPTLSIGDASVVEGNRGSSQLQFTVSRSGSGPEAVSVSYRTVDGTARANSDYSAASGTLTFPTGISTLTITIAVTGDRKREPNETFTVQLFNAVGASVVDAVATGTILNDD